MKEPTIVTKRAFTVVGKSYRGKNERDEIPELWRQFWQRHEEITHRTGAGVAYGVAGNKDPETGDFDYVAGLEVDDSRDIPPEMVSWDVPEQTYAVFQCTLPTLMATYQYVFTEWLPESEYDLGDGPEFELYDESFSPEEGEFGMFLYIPVKHS